MKLTLVKLLLPLSGLPAALTGPLFNGKGAVFEDALRQLCCAKPVCAPESCRLLQNCPISGLVARGVSPDPELLRRHQKPGLPYVFQIRYGRDEFDLVILGSAIAELALFLDVLFPQFSGNKTFAVTAFDNQNSPVAISFDSDGSAVNLPLLETSELLECSTPRFYTCRQIRIDLVTPLRMVRGGRELNRFDPVFLSAPCSDVSLRWRHTTARRLIVTISGILPVWRERCVCCVRLLSGIRLPRAEESVEAMNCMARSQSLGHYFAWVLLCIWARAHHMGRERLT